MTSTNEFLIVGGRSGAGGSCSEELMPGFTQRLSGFDQTKRLRTSLRIAYENGSCQCVAPEDKFTVNPPATVENDM
jgi:hypothetical protein